MNHLFINSKTGLSALCKPGNEKPPVVVTRVFYAVCDRCTTDIIKESWLSTDKTKKITRLVCQCRCDVTVRS